VGDQCVRPGGRGVPSRPWQREYGTPVLERVLRGDPRPAVRSRFNDDDDIRELGHCIRVLLMPLVRTTRFAAIYVRISRDREGVRAGVKRQREDCERLCRDRGWQVVDVYEDDDRSAFSGKPRPAYLAMLDALKAGM